MKEFLDKCRSFFKYAFFFSFFINVLGLTFPIYMLLIFDKVLNTSSTPTLVVLTVAALISLCVLAILTNLRSRLMTSVGVELDRMLANDVFTADIKLSGGPQGLPPTNTATLRDVQTLRNFLGGGGIMAFFDIPWMPIYFVCLFLLHPSLGVLGTVGGLLVFGLGYLTDKKTRKPVSAANNVNSLLGRISTSAMRNADIVRSMGMIGNISQGYNKMNDRVLQLQTNASRSAGTLQAIMVSTRMALQVLVYGIGAFLAVQNIATAGIMIAASIVMGKALAPIQSAMGTYKNSINAWQSYKKLRELLDDRTDHVPMTLPDPRGDIAVENLYFAARGRPIIKGVSFHMAAGRSLAIIGPSASGKSTLCKLLLNIWTPTAGKVRLDKADIANWDPEKLGPFLGYLPQDVELFAGTLAENICRMGPVNPQMVIAAANMAGVHEMVLRFPHGYDTYIEDMGASLSGGQRQRIGLARAIYGNPRLVVLDEPNSNLDEEGERQLARTLEHLKEIGTTVILVTHKPQILGAVDNIMVMQDGQIVMSGPARQVLAKIAEMHAQQEDAARARIQKKPPQGNPEVAEGQDGQ